MYNYVNAVAGKTIHFLDQRTHYHCILIDAPGPVVNNYIE
jgi:hypothetical protein